VVKCGLKCNGSRIFRFNCHSIYFSVNYSLKLSKRGVFRFIYFCNICGEKIETRSTCRKSLTNFITLCCIKYTSTGAGFELTTSVVIGTDYRGSCKFNYHTITLTVPSWCNLKLLTMFNQYYLNFAQCLCTYWRCAPLIMGRFDKFFRTFSVCWTNKEHCWSFRLHQLGTIHDI
jgi:hypothetical protein